MLENDYLAYVKDILYYAYKEDCINFPRSCGLVSIILTFLSYKTNLTDKYDISCIRGCFKNLEEDDIEWCEDFIDDIDRFNYKTKNCECSECNSCSTMIFHSWIELKDKKNEDIVILDFTSIQFEPNFIDFEYELSRGRYTKESLYEYINKRSLFIVDSNNKRFKNYIPLSTYLTLNEIINKVKTLKQNGKDNNITIAMEYLNIDIADL